MRITFTGDILCCQSQDRACKVGNNKYDYTPIFEQVKPLLAESDYVVGSFETTLAGADAGYTHAATSFNTPDDFLVAIKGCGINMLTTANNHCLDRGEQGLRRTIEIIKKSGLDYTGTRLSAEEPKYLIKDFDGTKIAFLSFTYGTNSKTNGNIIPKGKEYLVNLTRQQDAPNHRPLWKRMLIAILPQNMLLKNKGVVVDCVSEQEVVNGRNSAYEKAMIETIIEAKKKADIVIMCLHSGGQFNSRVGAYTQHLFNIIAEAGVDAVVCNHAHTTLPIYYHRNCLIASALGNFSFAPGEGYWVDGVNAEYSALLTFDLSDKKISGYSIDICKCVHDKNGLAVTVPVIDEDEKKQIMNRLNQ